jgi:4-hydroxybenzoate polyprenyltransferase/phosphoserine phosphatase
MEPADVREPPRSGEAPELSRPLVVDLDGTLIRTDLLHESASQFLIRNPSRSLSILGWLPRGRAHLKAELAKRSQIDVSTLPLNEPLVAWLREQRAQGRSLILATASHRSLAEQMAARLGFFDDVLATDETVNLKSEAKRDALVKRFGERGFDYVGNEAADLPIWKSAANAIVVAGSPALVREVRAIGNLSATFDRDLPHWTRALLRAMRPHQWVKNLLLFVPLLAAHRYGSPDGLLQVLIAFVVFSMTASSVYLLNDLVDVSDDRHHARKRNRPFASGALSLLGGWLAWPALLVIAFAIAALALPGLFVASLAVYFTLTVAYSLRLKQSPLVDVLSLASLYTLRIVAGAAAIAAPLSFWLLAFSMFIFLSLACIKRYSELKWAHIEGRAERIPGRGYFPADFEIIALLGVAAGYNAVLVLALYIHDGRTAELYHRPEALWLLCPLLLYWISRAWLFTHRGWMNEDPIVFALKDRMSLWIGALAVGAFVLARSLP